MYEVFQLVGMHLLLTLLMCEQSTYTGVYANGGPTNFDGNKDLSSLADRSAADVRGIPITTGSTFAK